MRSAHVGSDNFRINTSLYDVSCAYALLVATPALRLSLPGPGTRKRTDPREQGQRIGNTVSPLLLLLLLLSSQRRPAQKQFRHPLAEKRSSLSLNWPPRGDVLSASRSPTTASRAQTLSARSSRRPASFPMRSAGASRPPDSSDRERAREETRRCALFVPSLSWQAQVISSF